MSLEDCLRKIALEGTTWEEIALEKKLKDNVNKLFKESFKSAVEFLQIETAVKYVDKVTKMGRGPSFKNKNAHNIGHVVHLIEGAKPNGIWTGPALCKTVPGKRSLGWTDSTDEAVTCKKCMLLLKKSSLFQVRNICYIE